MESISTFTFKTVRKRRIIAPILVSFIFLIQNIVLDLVLVNVDKFQHSPLLILDLFVLIICMFFTVKAKWGIRHPNVYWIVWLIMSCDMFYKLSLIFISFDYQLEKVSSLVFLDHHALKLMVYMDCIMFKIFVESQYNSPVKSRETAFVNFISETVYLDYVDALMFLSFLYRSEIVSQLPNAMRHVVMCTAFFILLEPSLVLFILHIYQYGAYKVPQLKLYLIRMALVLLVNVPSLTVRIVLLVYYDSISVMFIKNVIVIIISVREFVTLSNQETDEDSSVSTIISSVIDSDAVYLMLDDVFRSTSLTSGGRRRTNTEKALYLRPSFRESIMLPTSSSVSKTKQPTRHRKFSSSSI